MASRRSSHAADSPSRPTGGGSGRTTLALLAGVITFVLACGAELTVVGALLGIRPGASPAVDGQPEWAGPAAAPAGPSSPPPAGGSPSPGPSGEVETKRVRETARIPFPVQTVEDATVPDGQQVIRTRGVTGQKTLTYEVTYVDGEPTGKRLVDSVVTRVPVTQIVAVGTSRTAECDPNYSGCVPVAEDVDCAGRGDGPTWITGTVKVTGEDVYNLDRNDNGIACDEKN
ncbi:G5 domain-containing protein [Micromonospora cathayae]|uniref:G5 domain-containing protein n=1 Tax=Micromonospora cathayae TaxID=3028804 RepID=A0ABY7ZVB3_9ACTN|nr:G5 domain-containing protein [Micromonospora sp. HUAS 3]WDZ86957.1 G5 domain-containing protein [Micromonospora sp. HUAS 3]